jgi:hypothetical protein
MQECLFSLSSPFPVFFCVPHSFPSFSDTASLLYRFLPLFFTLLCELYHYPDMQSLWIKDFERIKLIHKLQYFLCNDTNIQRNGGLIISSMNPVLLRCSIGRRQTHVGSVWSSSMQTRRTGSIWSATLAVRCLTAADVTRPLWKRGYWQNTGVAMRMSFRTFCARYVRQCLKLYIWNIICNYC